MHAAAQTGLAGVKLGFIGAGSMGGAMIRSLLASGAAAPADVVFYEPDQSRAEAVAALGARPAADLPEVLAAQVIVLAVKPQVLPRVLKILQGQDRADHLFISIVAGAPLAKLEAALPQSRIIRAMPNTAMLVAAATTAVAAGRRATAQDLALAQDIFDTVGLSILVEEQHMDAVTGLSGSGPAYVAVFIEALADGGVMMGLPRHVALLLAAQTVLGAAKLCLESELHPGQLKDRVASPAGTTIEGLHVLERGRFRGLVMSAVAAATRRSEELGRKH